MSGKNSRLNPLELRKQLLLAESELNRAQLAGEIAALKTGVHALTHRVKSFEAIASSGAVLLTGLMALRRPAPAEVNTKHSWCQSILNGASFISTLWLALQPRHRDMANNSENPR